MKACLQMCAEFLMKGSLKKIFCREVWSIYLETVFKESAARCGPSVPSVCWCSKAKVHVIEKVRIL